MRPQAPSISGRIGHEDSARPFEKASSGADCTRWKQAGSLNADPLPALRTRTPLKPAACALRTRASRSPQSKVPLPGGRSTADQRMPVARARRALVRPEAKSPV
jgi:hypothetical protein